MVDFVERYWRSAEGLSLHARDYPAAGGSAQLPVICIHGLTRNARDFESVAPWIAGQGRRVLAVDIRGRGRSDHAPDPMRYQLPAYARDMLAMMDSLGIARAIFIGTSMGGLITLMVSALRIRAVAGAVFNDVGPEVSGEGIKRIAGYAGKPVTIENWGDAVAYLRRTSTAAFPDFDDSDWLRLAARGFIEDADGKPVLDYDPAIAVPIGGKPPRERSWLAWLLFLRLARRRPALLLRGALSDILSADTARRMRRAAPGMAFAEIPRIGHAPLLEEAESQHAIADFLSRLP